MICHVSHVVVDLLPKGLFLDITGLIYLFIFDPRRSTDLSIALDMKERQHLPSLEFVHMLEFMSMLPPVGPTPPASEHALQGSREPAAEEETQMSFRVWKKK